MAYIECPQCGQKALSVATRCPRCGHAFPAHSIWDPVPEPKHLRLWPVLRAAGGLVAVAAMVLGIRHLAPPRRVTPAPVAASLDTGPSLPSAPDSGAPALVAGGVPPFTAPSTAAPAPARPPLQRWATTWVNIRSGRGGGTPLVRVLTPGEVVLVDSLRQGWYRVQVDGRTLGYVDRAYLDAVPPREHR